jgi:hypothetical protein
MLLLKTLLGAILMTAGAILCAVLVQPLVWFISLWLH